MPSLEKIRNTNNPLQAYNKVLARFYRNDADTSVASRNARVDINFRDNYSYEEVLKLVPSGEFITYAGCDLAALMFPFQSRNTPSGMPSFDRTVGQSSGVFFSSGLTPNLVDLLPFQWDKTTSGTILLRLQHPSGDSLPSIISNDAYFGSTNEYRNTSDIRSLGLRLPMMAVGWGYTTDLIPWPSGTTASGVTKFKGDVNYGWQVDPIDYVAAPIDLRYDRQRNVWTSPIGFWAKITAVASTTSGISRHYWSEMQPTSSGSWRVKQGGRTGTATNQPAFEANNREAPINTIVWMVPKEMTSGYHFNLGGTSSGLPPGIGRFKVLQITDDGNPGSVNWDYVRMY